jgi:hypothetical protein
MILFFALALMVAVDHEVSGAYFEPGCVCGSVRLRRVRFTEVKPQPLGVQVKSAPVKLGGEAKCVRRGSTRGAMRAQLKLQWGR